jgi:glucosylceramidase
MKYHALLLLATALGAADGPIQVHLTTGDGSQIIAAQPDLAWAGELPADAIHLRINDREQHQAIVGFGANTLDACLDTVTPELRQTVLRKLFHPVDGIGLGFIRIPMLRTFDTAGDETLSDEQVLERYRAHIETVDSSWRLRFAKDAQAMNPDLRVVGSPWSAPAFMKDSGKIGHGNLKPEWYETYADLMVRWVQQWQAAGIPVHALTLQNEPQFEPGWYPGMRMEPLEQIAFSQVLGRALERAGLNTSILCHDHNWDDPESPVTVMNDPEARRWLAGAAFHGYGGDPDGIARFLSVHPDKDVYGTELTGSFPSTGWGGSMQWQTTRVMQLQLVHMARSAMTWPLVKAGATDKGDRPIIRVHPGEGEGYTIYGEYSVLGHFSRFLQRGARRLGCSFPGEKLPYATAFRNPDGSKVLVANVWGPAATIAVHDGPRRFVYQLPTEGVATFRWRDAEPAPALPGRGLHATWYDSGNLNRPHAQRIDPQVDLDLATTPPAWRLGLNNVSARWTGMLRSPTDKPVRLILTSDDGSRLFIGNRLVVKNWRTQAPTAMEATETLGPAGTWVPITIEYWQGKGGGMCNFSWAWDGQEPVTVPRESLMPEQGIVPSDGDGLRFSLSAGGKFLLGGIEPTVERDWTMGIPSGPQPTLTATWNGTLVADRSGRHTLGLLTDNAASIGIDGRIVAKREASVRTGELLHEIDLVAGKSYALSVTCTIDRRKAWLDQSGATLRWRLGAGAWQVIPQRQLRSR